MDDGFGVILSDVYTGLIILITIAIGLIINNMNISYNYVALNEYSRYILLN